MPTTSLLPSSLGLLLLTVPLSGRAAPAFTAQAGPTPSNSIGHCSTLASGGVRSPGPVGARVVCGDAFGANDVDASAGRGRVSAIANASSTNANSFVSATAAQSEVQDEVVFSRTDPNQPATGPIQVALNVLLTVSVNAADPGSAWFQIEAFRAHQDLSVDGQGRTIVGFNDFSPPLAGGAGPFAFSGLLRTPLVSVPLDRPVPLKLGGRVKVSASQGGSGSARLEHFGLPVGVNVFALPEGYTANAPGLGLVDNRIVSPHPIPAPTDAGDAAAEHDAGGAEHDVGGAGDDDGVGGPAAPDGGADAAAPSAAPDAAGSAPPSEGGCRVARGSQATPPAVSALALLALLLGRARRAWTRA